MTQGQKHLKTKYRPGNLLFEWGTAISAKTPKLLAVYFVVAIDNYEATVWCMYDHSGYFSPNQIIEFYHEDLHRNSRSFKWTMQ